MRLEDVTILSSISPVQIKEKPSQKTKEFLAQIFSNVDFTDQINQLRNQNKKLTEVEPDIHMFIGKNFSDIENEPIYFAFQVFSEQLLNKYGLHKNMALNVALITYFNSVIDLEDIELTMYQEIEFVATKKAISNHLWDLPYEACALVVPYSSKVSDLKKYIDEHKDEIEKKMEMTLFNNTFMQKIHEKTELASEIIHLRDSENMKFPEISTILSEKYPNETIVFDEIMIRTLYDRYKNKHWKLNKSPK